MVSSDQYNYKTSSATQGNLIRLFYKTNRYGKYSVTVITGWVMEQQIPSENEEYFSSYCCCSCFYFYFYFVIKKCIF